MSGVSLLIFKSSKVTKLVNAGSGGLVEFASTLQGLAISSKHKTK